MAERALAAAADLDRDLMPGKLRQRAVRLALAYHHAVLVEVVGVGEVENRLAVLAERLLADQHVHLAAEQHLVVVLPSVLDVLHLHAQLDRDRVEDVRFIAVQLSTLVEPRERRGVEIRPNAQRIVRLNARQRRLGRAGLRDGRWLGRIGVGGRASARGA